MASLIEGLAGQQHGNWKLGRMLGSPGAFAVVYEAHPTTGGSASAPKLLKPERTSSRASPYSRSKQQGREDANQ